MGKRDQQVQIQTFGFFDIFIGDESAIRKFGSSKKTIALFKYFVAHIGDKLPSHKILEANFSEYNYQDPGNTLRGHIHRLRGVLNDFNKRTGIKTFSLDYIADYYVFSVGKNCRIDFLEFLDLCKDEPELKTAADQKNLDRIKELYRGSFLQDSDNLDWVRPIRHEYRKKFSRHFISVLEKLVEEGRYQEALQEADAVMERLFFEEDFQALYFKLLIALGKNQEAMDHYEFLSERYHNEKGTSPTEKLTVFFKKIQEATDSESSIDFFSIEKKLRQMEEGVRQSAFFCSKEFFLDLYRLETRRKKRNDKRVTSVGLITMATADYRDMSKSEVSTVQDKIIDLLSKNIREQDVMTVLNDTQVGFMLFDAMETTVINVDDRIKQQMDRICREHNLVMTITFKTITQGEEYSREITL